MGKTCAVPGCKSGHCSDRIHRKKLGLRTIALFSTPKCESRLRQWSTSLGCELNVRQSICQLHFMDRDIQKSYKTVLSDGIVHELDRGLWTIRDDAVPILQHQKITDMKNNNDCTDNEIQSNNEANFDEGKLATNPENNDSVTVKPQLACEQIVEEYTIDSLKEQLKEALLPTLWAWNQRPTGIVFTLLHYSDFHPALHLEVGLDLSLQIRTKTNTVMPLNDHATSFASICTYMSIFQKSPICTGTGIESERYDRRCVGILDTNEEYCRQRSNIRCMLCRSLRGKLLKQKKQSMGLRQKFDDMRNAMNLARRREIRNKKRVIKLLSIIANLKRERRQQEN